MTYIETGEVTGRKGGGALGVVSDREKWRRSSWGGKRVFLRRNERKEQYGEKVYRKAFYIMSGCPKIYEMAVNT
jgi:hypothetical protein